MGLQIVPDVRLEVGNEYAEAVRRCFARSLQVFPTVGDDQWLEFDCEVVMRLKNGLEKIEELHLVCPQRNPYYAHLHG